MTPRTIDEDPQIAVTAGRITRAGQCTVPAAIRKRLDLVPGTPVTILAVGDAVIIVPQRSAVLEAGANVDKILAGKDIALSDLLTDLDEQRRR